MVGGNGNYCEFITIVGVHMSNCKLVVNYSAFLMRWKEVALNYSQSIKFMRLNVNFPDEINE